MNYKWDSTAKHGIGTVLSTVPHTVMTAISSDDYVPMLLHLVQKSSLILLPVKGNGWKQFFLDKYNGHNTKLFFYFIQVTLIE
jgi:hypothetical protein